VNASPLQKRILVELVSDIRDREPDRDFWTTTDVGTGALFQRCASLWPLDSPERSHVVLLRNARQAFGRSLHRLQSNGLVSALALAWCDAASGDLICWQGGGRRQTDPDGWRHATPRLRCISPTEAGISEALLIRPELVR